MAQEDVIYQETKMDADFHKKISWTEKRVQILAQKSDYKMPLLN
jgi:hypothetical protein